MRFLLRVVFTAIAVWLVTLVLGGIEVRPFAADVWASIATYLLVALVFSLVNATLGNLIRIVAFPIYLITLGLVSLLVNGFLLLVVHWLSEWAGFGLHVDGFWWGVLGAVCISFVTWLITVVTRPVFGKRRPPKQ